MARSARVVVRGIAHYVTQQGNRRRETFFDEEDYAAYPTLQIVRLAKRGRKPKRREK
jgi:REP element-mobilizing transposase RayT